MLRLTAESDATNDGLLDVGVSESTFSDCPTPAVPFVDFRKVVCRGCPSLLATCDWLVLLDGDSTFVREATCGLDTFDLLGLSSGRALGVTLGNVLLGRRLARVAL